MHCQSAWTHHGLLLSLHSPGYLAACMLLNAASADSHTVVLHACVDRHVSSCCCSCPQLSGEPFPGWCRSFGCTNMQHWAHRISSKLAARHRTHQWHGWVGNLNCVDVLPVLARCAERQQAALLCSEVSTPAYTCMVTLWIYPSCSLWHSEVCYDSYS